MEVEHEAAAPCGRPDGDATDKNANMVGSIRAGRIALTEPICTGPA